MGNQPPVRRFEHSDLSSSLTVVATLSAVLLSVGIALVPTMSNTPAFAALALVGVAGLYFVAGLVAWRLRPHNRIGVLLLLTGLSIWMSGLVDVPAPVLSMLAVVTATLPLAMTVHLLLAFPSGRVAGRVSRAVVITAYVACTVMEAPLYLVGDGPLAVIDQSPGPFMTVAALGQSAVGLLTMVAAAVIVAAQAVRADPVARRRLGPLVWYRVLAPILIVSAVLFEIGDTDPVAKVVLVTVELVAIAGLPLAFLVGLLSGSFGRDGDVKEMVELFARVPPTASQLSAAVARTLGDPRASVLYRRHDASGYVDEHGRPVVAPSSPGARRTRPVTYNGSVVGAIVYDEALLADDSALDVLAGVVAMAMDQQRLDAEQRATLLDLRLTADELHQSGVRLLQAADSERRRIARDLHDGAQQHIVMLGMSARELSLRAADPDEAEAAGRIADGLIGLLTEFRELVSGIMPAPLIERGLAAAVRDLADRMPICTGTTTSGLLEQLAPEIESTAYFFVSEALTNAIKHSDASSVDVTIQQLETRLAVSVIDNGRGGATVSSQGGLGGLADRVLTLGGSFDVESSPGRGTTVSAMMPCA
ncbi:MAG: ATP-binding protein [Terracoccus sp.]